MDWQEVDIAEHIRQSNLIEDIHDPVEVDQSLKAWKYLMGEKVLTHDVIHHTQGLIVANQDDLKPHQRGYYRDKSQVNVTVGSYYPPVWGDVPELMEDWLTGADKRTPWVNHVYFEGIHPFVDGNGRTGRMLLWRQQIEAGYGPQMFLAAHRFDYYRELEWYRMVHSADMKLILR